MVKNVIFLFALHIGSATVMSVEFDLPTWVSINRQAIPIELAGHSCHAIFGPVDAHMALTVRSRMMKYVDAGESFATDLFLLEQGESDEITDSKIGGRPYLKTDEEWPKSPNGNFLPFLCQFNFKKSKETVDVTKLPGDLGLIFGDPQNGFRLLWRDIDEGAVEFVNARNDLYPKFSCHRWRCKSFPKHRFRNKASYKEFKANETTLRQTGFAFSILGMQIGHGPFVADSLKCSNEEVVIACIPGVNTGGEYRETKYPLVNHESPQIPPKSRFSLAEKPTFLGIVYILSNQTTGETRCVHCEF